MGLDERSREKERKGGRRVMMGGGGKAQNVSYKEDGDTRAMER